MNQAEVMLMRSVCLDGVLVFVDDLASKNSMGEVKRYIRQVEHIIVSYTDLVKATHVSEHWFNKMTMS